MSGCRETAMEFRIISSFLSPGFVRERKFFKGENPSNPGKRRRQDGW